MDFCMIFNVIFLGYGMSFSGFTARGSKPNDNMSGLGKNLHQIDWSREDLITFTKEFYTPHPDVTAMTDLEVENYRREHQMTIEGSGIPRPVRRFEEAGFPGYLLTELAAAGFTKPTPIQCQGWPMALSGRDLIGVAETGSGKTLAFILPGIVHINAQPLMRPGDGPIVLVLCPTRELAVQIKGQCDKFGYTSKIKNTCLYGGVPKFEQQRDLDRGVEIGILRRLLFYLFTSNRDSWTFN